MDLDLFSKYIGKTAPCMKAIVDLAKLIQEEENVSDDEALALAHRLTKSGITALLERSLNLSEASV